ncbi:MAG: AAA family ATPase [Deltaproteobacteria bacterium]|nr:AAA family ATPase [Deltaproteobacteria bacterium]
MRSSAPRARRSSADCYAARDEERRSGRPVQAARARREGRRDAALRLPRVAGADDHEPRGRAVRVRGSRRGAVSATVELVVFSGLQAAGKSTFYRERFATTHVHVSKDAWPNARNREGRQRRLIEAYLRAGQSVVVDNTNPSVEERAPLVAIARAVGARTISYAFVTTVDDALRRNASREGRARVIDDGIRSVAKKLTAPTADEDFDERFTVTLGEGGFAVVATSSG